MDADVEALLAGLSDDEAPRAPAAMQEAGTAVAAAPTAELEPAAHAAQLDAELAALAADLQRLYAPRAPQLAAVGLSAREMSAAVRVLGNEAPGAAGAGDGDGADPLAAAIGSAHALAVRLSGAEDPGVRLEPALWRDAERVAERIAEVAAAADAAVADAAARIPSLAPNLARIVDARVAARLLARAGSLQRLAATPPANLVSLRSSPLLADPLVDQVPAQHRRQAMRMVAAKAVLAARMDSAAGAVGAASTAGRDGADDTQGRLWRREIETRIDRLLAAPPSLQHRALPKPVDKKASRRGGRRVRKQKAKQAPTKLAREQNFIPFGG